MNELGDGVRYADGYEFVFGVNFNELGDGEKKSLNYFLLI